MGRKRKESPATNGHTENQQYIGDTDPRIPELEEAGQRLLSTNEQLGKARDNRRVAGDGMLKAMHTAGVDSYKCSGRIFTVEPEGEKVVVKKVKLSETANA